MLRAGPIMHSSFDLSESQFRGHEQDPINVQSVLRFVRRGWKLVAVWVLVGLCVGILFISLARSYYTSASTLLLEDRTVKPFPEASSGSETADNAFADSQVHVLRSREVLGRVIAEHNLLEDDEFGRNAQGLRAKLLNHAPFLSAIIPAPRMRSDEEQLQLTMMRVENALSIQRLGMSNAIEIAFTSTDRARAAEIANAVASTYISTRLELKQKARDEAAAQLRERLAEVREKAFNTNLALPGRSPQGSETPDQVRGRFIEMQGTTDTYRALYNTFLQRYTEAVQQLTVPGARIINPAEPPLDPSWPSLIITMVLGAFAGAGLGFTHALLRHITDRTLRDNGDLPSEVEGDLLTQIGRVRRREWKLAAFDQNDLQYAYLKAAPNIDEHAARMAVHLLTRRINTQGSTIGIAAIQEGAGASTIAVHLARILARSGLKTLLIDAAWKDSVTFQEASAPLSDARALERIVPVDLEHAILDVLVIRGGFAITDLTASQIIASAIMRKQGEYACIIVDCHGLDRTADVVAGASLLDEVILIAEAGRTTSEDVAAVLRLLPREKVSLVLNKTQRSS